MKKDFNRIKKLQKEIRHLQRVFDIKIQAEYGFSYSDTDCDAIIDTLDYATDDIKYKDFVRLMKTYEKNLQETGEFGYTGLEMIHNGQ